MGGAGNDTMRGGEGIDCADYEAVAVALNVNLATGAASGEGVDILLEIENISAGSGNDTLVGNSVSNDIEGGLGNDMVDAGVGNDTLEGGVGNDSLLGGTGNDELMGGVGNDTMRGGEGIDCADYEAVSVALNVNLATGTASGEGVDILLEIENICAGVVLGSLISFASTRTTVFGMNGIPAADTRVRRPPDVIVSGSGSPVYRMS
jgi:Ca2+-binding RTX toxin-like protein